MYYFHFFSRSLSPTTSLRSLQSTRSLGGVRRHHGRAKSPKRVTYDNRVTVRNSDANDSMFAELSTGSPQRPRAASLQTSNHISKDSGLDYSTQLRDLSNEIIKTDWSERRRGDEGREDMNDSGYHHQYHHHNPGYYHSQHSPHGILKESQNSRDYRHSNRMKHSSEPHLNKHSDQYYRQATDNSNQSFGDEKQGNRTKSYQKQNSEPGIQKPEDSRNKNYNKTKSESALKSTDKENTPNGSPPPGSMGGDPHNRTANLSGDLHRDYETDRTFSYRKAITDQYGKEVRELVEAGAQEQPNEVVRPLDKQR